MRKLFNPLFFSLLLLAAQSVRAQLNEGGFPLEEKQDGLKSATAIPTINMPSFDVEEDKATQPKCGKKFAHKFKTDISIKGEGAKTSVGNSNIWRLAIKSEGAYSLNIILKDFHLPEGGRLFLYSPGKEELLGAFTQKNNTERKFAISPIGGDELVVEYEEPADTEFEADLTIESVNHDYRNLKSLPNFAISEECEVDAAANEVHLSKRSSCLLMIDGQVFCSGNLVNNTAQDGNPYIVSAGHCFWKTNSRGKTELDTSLAQTVVAFFNYETPSTAWPVEGSKEMSLSGATTIASRMSNDMLLIRMNQVPPIDFRTYYAGWNRENNIQGPVHVFHHPQGDVKKISTDEATPSSRSYGDGFASNAHWRIYRWDTGMTEGGSSGSGLFDRNDLLLGNLTGGDTASSCERPGDDFFWKIGEVWNDNANQKQNLGPWLDPLSTGSTTLSGSNPYKSECRRVTNRQKNETPAVVQVQNADFAVGNNKKGITEFAEKFTCSSPTTLYGVYFFPMIGYYRNQYPIYLRIYSGENKPDSLLYEQRVRITTSQYQRRNGEFTDEETYNMGGTENYLRLSESLKLEGSFFISFVVPESGNTKVFALNYSEPREKEGDNTAFFLNADKQWLPFTQHPTISAPTTLMADAVLKDGWDDDELLTPSVPEIPVNPQDTATYADDYLFYPSLTEGELNFRIPKGDELRKIQIADMNGHTQFIKEGIDAYNKYTIDVSSTCHNNDTYILVATYKNSTKTFRFVKWKRNFRN